MRVTGTCEERAGIHWCININKLWPVTRGGLWTPFRKKLLSLLNDRFFWWFKLVPLKRIVPGGTANSFSNHWWNKYSGIPLYGLPLNTDTRISRTVSFVPTESSYIFSFERNRVSVLSGVIFKQLRLKRAKRTLWHAPSVSVYYTYRTLTVSKMK